MLTIQEIRVLSDKELEEELNKSSRELIRLKLAVKLGQEKATHKVRDYKNYIAQLNTIITEFKKEQQISQAK